MFSWSVPILNWLFSLTNHLVCSVTNNIFHIKIEFKCFGSHADDGELIQSEIVVENKLSGLPHITHRVDHKSSGHTNTNTYKIQTCITACITCITCITQSGTQKHWTLKDR